MKKLLIILIALLISGEGWGATAYVLPAGSNTSPYDTPAKAANAINTAVTYLNGRAGPHNLYVGPGNYTDYPLLNDADMAGLTMLGLHDLADISTLASEDEVVINVQAGNHGLHINKNNITIKGFTIKNAPSGKYNLYIASCSNPIIQHNYLKYAYNMHVSAVAGFDFTYNTVRGTNGKTPTICIYGNSTGNISYNKFGPSQTYSNGYIYLNHAAGYTVNMNNNDITGSYVYAVLHGGAGTTNFNNNKVWGNHAITYYQPQAQIQPAINVTAGAFNYDYNFIHGTPLKNTAPVSGGNDGGHNIIDTHMPMLAQHNFSGIGSVSINIDDSDLDTVDALADSADIYGAKVTFFVCGRVRFETNYEARLAALAARGHAIEAHTWSHTDLDSTTVFDISYTGTDTNPTIVISASDTAGSISLTTTEGNDDYIYNFTSSHILQDWVDASSGLVTIDGAGKWDITNLGNTTDSPSSPYYSCSNLRCTSLAAKDAAVAATPGTTTVALNTTDHTTGFFKDELVDWRTELGAITGVPVTTMATPRAVAYDDALYTHIENAGYLGCRGSTNYSASGDDTSYIDLRKVNLYKITSIVGADFIPNGGTTEADVRKYARRIAGYIQENPALYSILWHGVGESVASNQLKWFISELTTYHVPVITFPDAISRVRNNTGWVRDGNYWTNSSLSLAENHHLTGASPCINAGSNAVWSGTASVTSYNGIGITNAAGAIIAPGGTVDIGAYEYRPSINNAARFLLLFD